MKVPNLTISTCFSSQCGTRQRRSRGRPARGPRRRSNTPDPNENCAPPGTEPAPTPFTPNTSLPMRTRKSVFALTAFEQSRLNAAYTALRALPASDPRTWLSQAHVHCFYCSGSQNVPSNVEIHGAWTFMPWHRCYLYFHERILASLVGDNTFALPGWIGTTRPTRRSRRSMPIREARSSISIAWPPSARLRRWARCSTRTASTSRRSCKSPTTSCSWGRPIRPGASRPASHGDVHCWTADVQLNLTVQDPDMGILADGRRDPVFFAHHGEIDRFWWS